MKSLLVAVLVFALSGLGLTSVPTSATTLTVCASGCAFDTIQAAVDAANPGSVVDIETGTFNGGITVGKNLTLNGAGAQSTIIQGGAPVITVGTRVTAVVSDLSITGGGADVGGGVANSGTLTLQRVDVSSNTARDQGGGVANNGTLLLLDATIHDNRAGAPFGAGGGIKNNGTLVIRDSTVSDNSAPAGGGIDNAGPLIMANSRVTGNGATLGGGIANAGLLTMRNSAINENVVEGDPAEGGGQGGGIYNHGRVTLLKSEVRHNTASADAYGVNEETGFGGGIYSFNGTVLLHNSDVSDNTADRDGGGIFNQARLGAIRTPITSNTAQRDGGGIFNDGGNVTLWLSPLKQNVPNGCVGCS